MYDVIFEHKLPPRRRDDVREVHRSQGHNHDVGATINISMCAASAGAASKLYASDSVTSGPVQYNIVSNDDDDDMTILMCAQKLTDASLIYRTEPKTKTKKMEKIKK